MIKDTEQSREALACGEWLYGLQQIISSEIKSVRCEIEHGIKIKMAVVVEITSLG